MIIITKLNRFMKNNKKIIKSQDQVEQICLKNQKPLYHKNNPISTLQTILQWRKTHQAPVDIVGCERLSDPNASMEIQKYQILISLILSVQTKDQITSKVVEKLKKNILQPKVISQMPEQQIIELIRQVNFNVKKAKNIKIISQIVLEKGLPKTIQQLVHLPGIGTKIAMIYMKVAEGKVEGIGVDTHVHRISNKLGWVNSKTPNQTEQQLQSLFPRSHWHGINIGLVGFGQILCEAKKPLCSKCPVNNKCPSVQLF